MRTYCLLTSTCVIEIEKELNRLAGEGYQVISSCIDSKDNLIYTLERIDIVPVGYEPIDYENHIYTQEYSSGINASDNCTVRLVYDNGEDDD